MAPQVGQYNLTNIRELQGLTGQFTQFGGNSEVSSWFNSAFTVAEDFENVTSSDSNQKASGIQGLINHALSLLDKISNKESKTATSDVKKNNEKSEKLNKNTKKVEKQIKKDIKGISKGIGEEEGVVKAATKEIEKANEELAKKQEEINKVIQQIEEAQKALASTTDADEQKKILENIQGLSAQIVTLSSSIAQIQSVVEDASKEVADSVSYIESLKGNAVKVQENGEMEIQKLGQEAAQNVQANTQTQANAKVNEATAEAAETAAETASINPLTEASVAPKLYRVAVDQELAGTIRNTGAATNLTHIMQGIGKVNDNASLLQSFNTTIGSALNKYTECVGGWNTSIESVITSIGSFTGDCGLNSQVEALDAAVKTDLTTIDNATSNNNENNNNEKNNNNNKKEETEEQVNELETPKVKVKQFGI